MDIFGRFNSLLDQKTLDDHYSRNKFYKRESFELIIDKIIFQPKKLTSELYCKLVFIVTMTC